MFGKINTQYNPMDNMSIKANTVLGLFRLTLDHSVSAGKLAIYINNKIFYWPFQGGTSFVDLLWGVFCLEFAMPLCASVYMCFVVTCWERADLLALVCGV